MKLFLTILPSEELQTKLNSYRKRYDPNYIFISPHVHFFPTFEIQDDDFAKLHNELTQFFSSKYKFPLEILRFSSLYPVTNLIYCKLVEHPFYQEITSYLDNITYLNKERFITEQPHIAIASELSNDEHSDLLGRVRLISFSKTETVSEIVLYKQLVDGKFEKVSSYNLK